MHTLSPGLFTCQQTGAHMWMCRPQQLWEMLFLLQASWSHTISTVLHHVQFWAYCVFNPLVPPQNSEELTVLFPDLPGHVSTYWSSLVAQVVKSLPATRETQAWFLGRENPLEKEMATHSSTLAWRIPWMEEPGRLQSVGTQRVGHDWVTSPHLPDLILYFLAYLCRLYFSQAVWMTLRKFTLEERSCSFFFKPTFTSLHLKQKAKKK